MRAYHFVFLVIIISALLALFGCNSVDGGGKSKLDQVETRGPATATTQSSQVTGGQSRSTETRLVGQAERRSESVVIPAPLAVIAAQSQEDSVTIHRELRPDGSLIVNEIRTGSASTQPAYSELRREATTQPAVAESRTLATTQPSTVLVATSDADGPISITTHSANQTMPKASGSEAPKLGSDGSVSWQEPNWAQKTGAWLYPLLGVLCVIGGIAVGKFVDLRYGIALGAVGLVIMLFPVIGFWLGLIILVVAAAAAWWVIHTYLASSHTSEQKARATQMEAQAAKLEASGTPDDATAAAELRAQATAIWRSVDAGYNAIWKRLKA